MKDTEKSCPLQEFGYKGEYIITDQGLIIDTVPLKQSRTILEEVLEMCNKFYTFCKIGKRIKETFAQIFFCKFKST